MLNQLKWNSFFPYRIKYNAKEPKILWKDMSGVRFTEPFFDETRRKVYSIDGSDIRETNWSTISKIAKNVKSIEPTGFIFHSSRCGSTLISQMLAKLNQNIVISEARLIDFTLRAENYYYNIDEVEKVKMFKDIIKIFGQKRFEYEKNFFIKFDAWSIAEYQTIHKAYPNVPWIFLYRNPIEIIVSHQRMMGMHMVPTVIKGSFFDNAPKNISFEEYKFWVLSEIFKSALKYINIGNGILINYDDIPNIIDKIPNFFGIKLSKNDILKMKNTLQFYSKDPSKKFKSDISDKQKEVTEDLKSLSNKWLDEIYIELNNLKSKTL